jgi:alkylation response protein AidB-like acyl-CoA dehydrogenase
MRGSAGAVCLQNAVTEREATHVNPDFGLYQLGPEHQALRETVRALAEKEIAPHAAIVDE